MTQSHSTQAHSSQLSTYLRWLLIARQRSQSARGFTLIELLVSMIIAALITVGLLTLVVQLTETNQRDSARSETQRDMQAAMDYIAQDLREAVYVYDGACLATGVANPYCPNLTTEIMPAAMSSGTRTPILAFWRTDPLPDATAQACRTAAGGGSTATPLPHCISGKTYSLVVYAVERASTVDGVNWPGPARLIRYNMTKFNASNQQNASLIDPFPDTEYTFRHWPYAPNGGASAAGAFARPALNTAGNSAAVLVDFLDDDSAQANRNSVGCPTGMAISPPAGAAVRSFYACISTNAQDAANAGLNQEVILNLRGNATGRAGFPKSLATLNFRNDARLSPMQTRVFVRGVLKKS